MKKLILKSPAKVNLFLRVVGRRKDGYHRLDTLFHRLSLADTLTLTKQDSDFSFFSNADLPPREGNLLFKAYQELCKKFPQVRGVRVKLAKRIPIGAGLGGGSSNAAFFLLGMVKLYGIKIFQQELMELGLRVGADVPFFLLQKKQALARGIGEKLKPLAAKNKKWFLLITDPKPLSTPAVYQHYRAHHDSFSKAGKSMELQNDLQASAVALRPSIAHTLRRLNASGAEAVLVSGSGPTVFAVSESKAKTQKWRRNLPVVLKKRSILCHTA